MRLTAALPFCVALSLRADLGLPCTPLWFKKETDETVENLFSPGEPDASPAGALTPASGKFCKTFQTCTRTRERFPSAARSQHSLTVTVKGSDVKNTPNSLCLFFFFFYSTFLFMFWLVFLRLQQSHAWLDSVSSSSGPPVADELTLCTDDTRVLF